MINPHRSDKGDVFNIRPRNLYDITEGKVIDMFRLIRKKNELAGFMYQLLVSTESVLKYSIIPGTEDGCIKESMDLVTRMVKDINASFQTLKELFKDSTSAEYNKMVIISEAYASVTEEFLNVRSACNTLVHDYIQKVIRKYYPLYKISGISTIERKIQRELFRRKSPIFAKLDKNPIADIINPTASIYISSMELLRTLIPETELNNINAEVFNEIMNQRFTPEEYEKLCDAISFSLVTVILEENHEWKNENSWLASIHICSKMIKQPNGLFHAFMFWCSDN